MFGVDERRHSPGLLRVGHNVQRQRGLTGRFRSVDLDDAPLGQTADAKRHIQGE